MILCIPQQRKLMGSLAQKSSGVHWCGRRVKFNEVPKRFRIRFNRFRGRIREALVQSQVRFNRVLEKVPEKVPEKVTGGFGAEPGEVQQGSGEGSGEGRGGFGSEPGQVQQGSGEGSLKVWEALVQSRIRFNRVPEKVPEKFPEKVGEGQVQQGSGVRFRRRPGRLWCKARSGSTGFRRRFRRRIREALVQSQVRFNRVPEQVPEKVPEMVPGSHGAKPSQVQRGPEKVEKNCKSKTLRLLGIPSKPQSLFIFLNTSNTILIIWQMGAIYFISYLHLKIHGYS